MLEGKGVRRRQLLAVMRSRRKVKIRKVVNDSLSHDHKEEIQVIFHKSMDLL
jgi:hypothetical protein